MYNISLLITVFLIPLIARKTQENTKKEITITKPHKSNDLQILKYAVSPTCSQFSCRQDKGCLQQRQKS